MSMLFTPFYLPFIGLVALFLFSYLSIFPWPYKLQVLTMVYLFTILMPTVMIHLYRRYQGWNLIELGHRERRMVPYVISIICYFTCVYVMSRMHMPHFMGAIVVAGLLVQIVCALINVWWKISTHTAAIGGVAGALFAFAEYLDFNPVWWGHQPHDSAPALAGPGRRWLLGRLPLRSSSHPVSVTHPYPLPKGGELELFKRIL